jgi:hypothetical protein
VLLAVARDEARRRELRRRARSRGWDGDAERRFLATAPGPTPAPGGEPLVTVVLPVRQPAGRGAGRGGERRRAVLRRVGAGRRRRRLGRHDAGGARGAGRRRRAGPGGEPAALRRLRGPQRRDRRRAGAVGRVPRLRQHLGAALPARVLGALERRAGEGVRAHAVVDFGAGSPAARRYLAFEGGLDELLVLNHVDLNTLVASRALLDDAGGFDPRCAAGSTTTFAIRLAAGPALPPRCRSSASATTTRPATPRPRGRRQPDHADGVRPLAVRGPRQGAPGLGRPRRRPAGREPGRVT